MFPQNPLWSDSLSKGSATGVVTAVGAAWRSRFRLAMLSCISIFVAGAGLRPAAAQQAPGGGQTLTINEYTIRGNHLLSERDVDTAVYPFLGPGQTVHSVDEARAALQAVYADKGYETVSVFIPPQHVVGGVVILQVLEAPIGRLNIVGSRYFSLKKIRSQARSLAPGQVPNFKHVKQDVIALNAWPDRQVTPSLQAGVRPDTVDVDLNVKDTPPLHGSLSLDNDYSQNTTPLRINGALSYDNLWQRGDTLSMQFQVAPERPNDALVFSGSYQAQTGIDWLSLLFSALISNSKVSSLGSTNVVGKGQDVGIRAQIVLPSGNGFSQALSTGIDYKNFGQDVTLAGAASGSPVTYYPLTASYSASWLGESATTQFDASTVLSVRGLGSGTTAFDNRRYESQSNFIYAKGDLSRQQDLPFGLQVYGEAQGQFSDQPLVNTEQFSLGGQGTVRGYLNAEVLGDNAATGSVELRSPQLAQYAGPKVNDWRLFVFGEGGWADILDALPEQQSQFGLASAGAGTRIQLVNHLNGSVDVAVPFLTSVATKAEEVRVEFRVWVQF